MPDDVAITPGAGATVAADDVGGKLHQRVKPTFGADGTGTDVSTANPLPTADASVLAAVDGVETALANLLTELGQKVEATDLLGLATQATLAALLADSQAKADLNEAQPVSDNGGSLTVDGTLALDAATLAALESITVGTALPAGNNNIGDVDMASAPADPFGANADASVAAGAAGSIQAKLRRATQGLEDLKSLIVLAAGTNNIGKVSHATTSVGSGRKVVTTAGTRVALASSTAANYVVITAETDNTGLVVVGSASGVIASLSTREGTPLAAGDSMTLEVDNLADIGLDSTVSGDGVTFTYGA